MGSDHFEKVKSGRPIMAEQKILTKENAFWERKPALAKFNVPFGL